MDFGTLLHMAKKNSETLKKESSSYYSAKLAPPKRESKEKKLSDNIQKFLQKKEQEEREKKRQEKEKLNKLLSMRDEKSKNKIRKMLKVTKSANKSVLDDCHGSNTAVTIQGPEQPDQDDYGYVSTEANAFYQKYIEKVKDVKDDKGFAPSRPVSINDLKGTKERVKAAITREVEDKKLPKQRTSHATTDFKSTSGGGIVSGSSHNGSQASIRSYSTTKCLYDPTAEREEEERKKRDEEQKRAKLKKPPPPIMDFHSLLKLAEKKQHEPIALPAEVKKPKEPERLLTSKEKRELEERKRAKEARERREKEKLQQRSSDNTSSKDRDRKDTLNTPRMEPNGRIPKLGQQTKPNPVINQSNSIKNTGSSSASKSVIQTKPNSQMPQEKSIKKQNSSETHLSTHSSNAKSSSLAAKTPSTTSSALNSKKPSNSGSSSTAILNKKPYDGPTREFPPRDVKSIKTRTFPPNDVRRSNAQQTSKSQAQKRRIIDDDEEDYDSEMDDFIDDGEEDADYSTHIKAIFGYDRSRYRDLDDFDDRAMESNFAQVQREEFISKKIGLQEDLEDMRLEAIEKKRKMAKKKKSN